MNYRTLGRTGWQVSEISFGAWAIGGAWGTVDDSVSLAALHKALDLGVNFIDTADVYGDGRSEKLIGQVLRERKGQRIYVATKAGRRLSPHVADGLARLWLQRSHQLLGRFQRPELSLLYYQPCRRLLLRVMRVLLLPTQLIFRQRLYRVLRRQLYSLQVSLASPRPGKDRG